MCDMTPSYVTCLITGMALPSIQARLCTLGSTHWMAQQLYMTSATCDMTGCWHESVEHTYPSTWHASHPTHYDSSLTWKSWKNIRIDLAGFAIYTLWVVSAIRDIISAATGVCMVSESLIQSSARPYMYIFTHPKHTLTRDELRHALQHTATHCNTLQHTATHCDTLQHNATHCNTLPVMKRGTPCNTLQRTATQCTSQQHITTGRLNKMIKCLLAACPLLEDLKIVHGTAYEWVFTSHMNESCHVQMSHVTYEWVIVLKNLKIVHGTTYTATEWRRPIGCLKLQVNFRKRATNYRTFWRKMTYKDKASYRSSPPFISKFLPQAYLRMIAFSAVCYFWFIICCLLSQALSYVQNTATQCNTMHHTATHCNALQHCHFLQSCTTQGISIAWFVENHIIWMSCCQYSTKRSLSSI